MAHSPARPRSSASGSIHAVPASPRSSTSESRNVSSASSVSTQRARTSGVPKQGYRRFAEYMAWNPAMAILPRFRAANMLTLLCLQAEISEVEQRLSDFTDLDDSSEDPVIVRFSRNWQLLKQAGQESEQWKLVLQLRAKLAEYNQALVHQITLHDQIGPGERNMRHLQKWLRDQTSGAASSFEGPGCLNWLPVEKGGRPLSDQVALARQSVGGDPLSQWVATSAARPLIARVLALFPSRMVERSRFLPTENDYGEDGYVIYGTADSLRSIGDKITSLVAVILILVPVIVLHFLNSATMRLIVIVAVAFSLSFTLVLVLTTDAKRSEIFAASAGFVAVQVVYVGSSLNSLNG